MSDLEVRLFLAATVPSLFLPVGIAWWKRGGVWPVVLLSLVFWPGVLVLALRMTRAKDDPTVTRDKPKR